MCVQALGAKLTVEGTDEPVVRRFLAMAVDYVMARLSENIEYDDL